jgi:outer membrane receptor protein involved in Fe transport
MLAAPSYLLAQERYGAIAGAVTDTSPAPVPGATVTATNKTTGATRTVVTTADGSYRVPDLDPGRYKVTVELPGFQRVEADDVLVLLGKTFELSPQLRVGELTETVNVTADATRQIDLTTVTRSHNVTAEEIDRLPKGRSFQGLALTAPGVNSGDIEAGFQVNGASGSENSYTVDGVVTNSLIDGRSRQNTVFEYLQEVEVKTVGVNAEYGGALGGVISAVTKSGGNTYRGEVHGYYFGSALSASPVERIQLSPVDNRTVFTPQDDKQQDNRTEIGGSLGGPIVKDKLFFFASLSPRFVDRNQDYLFSNGVEPGSLSRSATEHQAFGKVTYQNPRLTVNGSLLSTPQRSTGDLARYNGTDTNYTVTSLAAAQPFTTQGFNVDQYNASGDVNVRLTPSSFVSVQTGYFYDNYKDVGISDVTSYTYQTSSVGASNIPASLQGPRFTTNTPRTSITDFDTTSRTFVNASYNRVFEAGGFHSLKGGAGLQHTTNDVQYGYPGGYTYIYWNSILTGSDGVQDTGTYGYYRVDDLATRGKVGANIISLYAQDTWQVNSRLTVNLGLRTENEKVPSFVPEIQENAFDFSFAEKLAPRLGASYDLTGNGRLKLSGSWGRYFDWTKYSLSRGSFGGDIWHIYYRSLDTLAIDTLNVDNLPGRDLWRSPTGFRDLRATQFDAIDPNTKPMYQDSSNVGIEYQMSPTTVLTVDYIHNKLTRTIEDFSSLINGDNVYTIGNPGEGANESYAPAGPTPVFAMPRALRQYDALQVGFNRRFSRNWFFSANYTLSRLYGNYSGLADSDEILTPTTNVTSSATQQSGGTIARVGSNSHSAWDTDSLLWDSHGNLDVLGRLATDRPHVVKLYGAYTFGFGTQVGAFFYGGSGTPISTVVIDDQLEPVLVEGRGDMGRTPVLTRTDLLVSHEFSAGGLKRLRLELNLQNIFNQKTATHIFNFLNKGAPGGGSAISANEIALTNVDLSQGYDYRQLIRETPDGANSFDPRYGQPDLWQTGLQGQVSVKFIF